MNDDRASFLEEQQAAAAAMAADAQVRRLDLDLVTASDKHGYSYFWTWLGVPIIQMPTDVVVLQEIVWRMRPQLIIETGVARGGSVLLYASLLELIGEGSVLAVDIDIRPHNRASIEEHPLAHRVRLIEGSAIDQAVVDQASAIAATVERVMVVLDSNHTHEHVLAELEAYGPLVTQGQYLVVADTLIEEIAPQAHRPRPWGPGDNPQTALDAFMTGTDEFEVDVELDAKLLMTSNRGGYLRRKL